MKIEQANDLYVLVSHGEGSDPSSISLFKTREERDQATLDAIETDMHSEDAGKYLNEARTTGWIRFEGDPPLEWATLDELVASRLIAVARAAHQLADNAETSGPAKSPVTKVDQVDFDELSAALDALDELPELPDHIIGTGPAKAEHWLALGRKIRSINPETPQVEITQNHEPSTSKHSG